MDMNWGVPGRISGHKSWDSERIIDFFAQHVFVVAALAMIQSSRADPHVDKILWQHDEHGLKHQPEDDPLNCPIIWWGNMQEMCDGQGFFAPFEGWMLATRLQFPTISMGPENMDILSQQPYGFVWKIRYP